MILHLSQLLSAADSLSIRGEYKLWIYRNYILSLLWFHLCVDAVSPSAISKMESMATRYLKKWLQLPRSSTRVMHYYPGVCCPSISTISREAKLNLLSCVSASSDLQLQELGVHLRLGQDFLQVQNSDQESAGNPESCQCQCPLPVLSGNPESCLSFTGS